MSEGVDLAGLEAIIDTAGVVNELEAAMPRGGRPRQLPVRTLLVGIAATIADDRPAHLRRVHRALVALGHADQVRLGVLSETRHGPHTLTYRQVERTFSSLVRAMGPERLVGFCDAVVEASVPHAHKGASTSVAVDWTDHATWARPTGPGAVAADPDASWGHRNTNTPGTKDGLFFGYYAQAVTMVAEEGGAAVAELVRRICMHAPSLDPVPAMATTLEAMAVAGVVVGDVLADSGYAHRVAENWAGRVRGIGARLVQDLHPSDLGPKGTFGGHHRQREPVVPGDPAVASGNDAAGSQRHRCRRRRPRRAFRRASRYKLGRTSADDHDGYHRVACPAAAGKLRCPLKPNSMSLDYDRPEVLSPPGEPPRCCTQASITVPPEVNAKTRQQHDYPGPAFRLSYRRRTGVERSFSTFKDPATTDVRRGWCRLMGRAKNLVMFALATVVRNLRVLASFEARQADSARREVRGQAPRTRRRRRQPSPPTAA